MTFSLPNNYKEGMQEVVDWSQKQQPDIQMRFMLDVYRLYMEWKFNLEAVVNVEDSNV